MMEKSKEPISFVLKQIRTEQFAIVDEAITLNPTVNVNTSINFRAEKKDRVIGVMAHFRFEQDKAPIMIISVSCHFQVSEDSWNTFITPESSATVIPKALMTHFAMLTVGTARGVLHAKTEGTRFNHVLLPAINLTELIKEDVTFNY